MIYALGITHCSTVTRKLRITMRCTGAAVDAGFCNWMAFAAAR